MKGWRMNPDLNVVRGITTAIDRNDGHCPCVPEKDDTVLCPCDEFISGKGCHCNLFIKEVK